MADFTDKEVGLAVAATATLMSERARRWLRQGAVYGLAGVIRAGETTASAARGAVRMGEDKKPSSTTSPATAKRPTARPARAKPRTTPRRAAAGT